MNHPLSEQTLFATALGRPPGAARHAYLLEACGDDHALRRRVEALLAAAQKAGDFLEHPPGGLDAEPEPLGLAEALPEPTNERISRYRLLEQIGEGGCGVVYLAEQSEPVRRRVALKILRLGMDTPSMVARFEAERQALALMDHPNIAKVLDGGTTRAGRPFLVMELVRGIRITEFCEAEKLSVAGRLHLFVQVCLAVHHAHQKGIIHRDLKPSNILVTVNDGSPVPKVIDFGIAKAIDRQLSSHTFFTQFHSFLGTPAYTSPEQAGLSSVDVDTRSDVYSLGVLLYELLTGRTPVDPEELAQASLEEMRRIIRSVEPLRPSTQLTRRAARHGWVDHPGSRRPSAPTPADWPSHESISSVKGDLDWIVMKCLEKDRARRYDTVRDLASDIERHLRHEPVQARPPGKMYLLGRFIRRHRGTTVATLAVAMALLLALVTLALSNARIRDERNQRETALQERSAALATARASDQQAWEQLFLSLQSQVRALRGSRRAGQRLESLSVIAEAARMHATPALRDHAIAALALPDLELAPAGPGGDRLAWGTAYDSVRGRLAQVDRNNRVSVRSIPGEALLHRWETGFSLAGLGPGLRLAFSPDGGFVGAVAFNGEVAVWRTEGGQILLRGPAGGCTALTFRPDSQRVLLGRGRTLVEVDLATLAEAAPWPIDGEAHSLEFHPGNQWLAVGYQSGDTVDIHDPHHGRRVARLPVGPGIRHLVAWHPEGRLLATGSSDPRLQVWDVARKVRLARLEGHVQDISFLGFHADGDFLMSVSWDGSLRVWQPSPARLSLQVPLSGWLAYSRSGPWPGLISASGTSLQRWRVVASREYRTFLNSVGGEGSGFYDGDISPDGRVLVLGCTDGVRIWDLERGREVARLGDDRTYSAVFGRDGRELLTCGPRDGVCRWPVQPDLRGGAEWTIGPPHRVALPFTPKRLVVGPDRRMATVVGEDSGRAGVLDLAGEHWVGAPLQHPEASFAVRTSDGAQLATSGWNTARVRVWDGRTGRLIRDLEAGLMTRVFYTPDDRELILARTDEFVFHERRSLEVSRRFPRAMGLAPGFVAFHPAGTLMALEMAPGVIHLAELSSGRTVARLEDPQGDLSSWMAFTPGGTQLLTASRPSGAIHRWDLRALRTRLKEMNLDWDWPDFPTPEGGAIPATDPTPVRFRVDPGVPAGHEEAARPAGGNGNPGRP